MLKATIALSDLAFAPQLRDADIVFGSSRIAPLPHPALETVLARTPGQWFTVVRERATTSAGPAGCIDVDTDEFERRYRECLLWPLDYVMVEGAQAGRRIKVRASVLGSVPVYARVRDEGLALSWDVPDLIEGPAAIDPEVAARRLAQQALYAARQLCCGITMLTERASLFVEPGRASFHYPAPAAETRPAPADDREALAGFTAQLDEVIGLRAPEAAQVALELSGGMDSAAVACALAAGLGPFASLGILLEDETREPQVRRRRAIVEQLGLSDRTVEIAALPPSLDLAPSPVRRTGFHPEYYLEACTALWEIALAHGSDRLFTGIGGDELFPDYVHERPEAAAPETDAHRREAARLMTPRALDAAQGPPVFAAPASPVPATALMAHACRAPDIVRRGLWPVNPLSDPRLAAFCHRLPHGQRHGRELMRRYLQARLGDGVFPRGYRKETFEQVFPGLIARHAPALATQLRECALADLGLVQPRAVAALLDTVATTGARGATAALVSFLWLERFVRQVA